MVTRNYLAIDLGAESGRHIVGSFEHEKLTLSETYRFENRPVTVLDGLHWDVLSLWREIKQGLQASIVETQGLDSLGVDAWGVDFGLLDTNGHLLANPFHHRDVRTDGLIDEVQELIPKSEIYAQTGIQFMQINTLFQLFAMQKQRSPLFDVADTFVTIPDLFNYWLSGTIANEFTNATTTQCFNPNTRKWAIEILEKLHIPTHIFKRVVEPGTQIGTLLPSRRGQQKVGAIPVIAPACHDTGSAVVAIPAESDHFAWISSGTWSIMGTEEDQPIINHESLEHNFTNEGGVQGTWRFSKNVMGLWIVQECRRQWQREGEDLSYSELTRLADEANAFAAFIDPDDSVFLHPGDMATRIPDYCRRTDQGVPRTKGEVIRVVLEGIALKYRQNLEELQSLVGKKLETIHIIGGGSQNELLNRFTANATNCVVIAGPSEATSIGNILMQAIALNHLESLADARAIVRKSFSPTFRQPENVAEWDDAYARFREFQQSRVEASFEKGKV